MVDKGEGELGPGNRQPPFGELGKGVVRPLVYEVTVHPEQ